VRVALVSPYSLTLPGGVQGQVLGLARSLRAQGHAVRVLGPCDGPPPDVGITPLGNCIPLAANGSVAPIAPDVACALRTMRALWDEGFDIVHLHEPLVPGPTMTSLLFTSTPSVGTFHAAGDSAAYRWLAPITQALARRLSVRCAVSEDAANLARDELGGDYEVLFNGIEVDRFAKAIPWPTEGPTIFFVGRHEPRKGLDVLLEAWPMLGPDIRLWIAGDGPETAALKATTRGDERVAWLGRIDEDQLARRLRGADVFCAPSLHGESFGVVLLESMAAETPVVASDLPGYRNVARPGQEGVLVAPGDARALAKALSHVLEDRSLAACLVEGGRRRAAELSLDMLAERYIDIYSRTEKGGQ
jgi:phosphatidylinositol alpha-mannosyltransferase